jgi:prepilin-type N-terminal cleavage/methylation domain-containing protein
MKKGFTLIELLVASLLIGMLVTVLTMIFNQSSIAWRTGVGSVADLDDVRDNVAEVRNEADDAFVWNDKLHRSLGLWDENGKLRKRACDEEATSASDAITVLYLKNKGGTFNNKMKQASIKLVDVGNADTGGKIDVYTVNVMSAGPDREFNTWDDIWSFPDDFE